MNTGRSLAKLIVIAVVMLPLVSCSFFDQVGALRTFRDANSLYGRKDYEAAVEAYRKFWRLSKKAQTVIYRSG